MSNRMSSFDLKNRIKYLWKFRDNDTARHIIRLYLRERDPNPDALCMTNLPNKVAHYFHIRDDYVAAKPLDFYLRSMLVECALANGETPFLDF